MSEATERLSMMMDGFDARVQAAPAGSWSNQSPCAEWKARDVVVHVADNYLTRVGQLTGKEVPMVGADEDIVAAWNRARDGMRSAMDSSDLSQTLTTPMGPMPAEMFIGRLMSVDTLVHTWDLARAVGGNEQLDEDAVGHAYEGLKPMDAMIRMPGVFGPKIESPAGADLQTQFLNFIGRTV